MFRRLAPFLVALALGCRREAPPAPAPSAGESSPPPSAASAAPAASAEHRPHAHGRDGYHMDFSETERFAQHFDGPERDAWQKPDEVLRLLDVRPAQTVVDLGSGTGYFVGPLSRAVGPEGRVLGLDAEPKMSEHLTRRAKDSGWKNVTARTVPPDSPELEPKSVDRILIVNTWHHIDERTRYAQRLARGLRPGGFVLIVDFTLESDIGPPPDHRLAPEQVVRELSEGGLSAEIVRDETLPKQYVVRGTLPAR